MPPIALSVLAFIQLAIKAAPAVKQVYQDGRELIDAMFAKKLITKKQQKDLMAWCDEHEASILAGQMPPELEVDNTVHQSIEETHGFSVS